MEMFLFGLMVYMFISLFVNHKWITKRQKLIYFVLFALIIYCSNIKPSRLIPLKLEKVGTYSVTGKNHIFIHKYSNQKDKVGFNYESSKDYEVLIEFDTFKVTKGRNRNELLASFKMPGEILSIYTVINNFAICKLNDKNLLIGFNIFEDDDHIIKLKKYLEIKVDASRILWFDLCKECPLVTQSVDKKTLYYFDRFNGNLKYKKEYKKPVNFTYFRNYGNLCVGYDGENLIYQEMPDSGIAKDKIFKMPIKQDSIDKSFFQLVRYLGNHIQDYDFFDGKYLWRCSLNSETSIEISNPLEIKEPGIGYILGPYPYRDGTCIVYGNYKNLTISKIDTKKWKPLCDYYGNSLFGCLEGEKYRLRLYEQHEKNDESRFGSHYYHDILLDGKPLPANQEIIEAYRSYANDSSYSEIFYLFSKDTIYQLKIPY